MQTMRESKKRVREKMSEMMIYHLSRRQFEQMSRYNLGKVFMQLKSTAKANNSIILKNNVVARINFNFDIYISNHNYQVSTNHEFYLLCQNNTSCFKTCASLKILHLVRMSSCYRSNNESRKLDCNPQMNKCLTCIVDETNISFDSNQDWSLAISYC